MREQPAAPWWLRLHALLMYAFLYFPIAVLVLFSFNSDRRNVAWRGWTLDWYRALRDDASLQHAVANSLWVASVATLASVMLGTLAAMALARSRDPWIARVGLLVYLPMMVPEIVLGIGLLTFFVRLHWMLSIWTVAVAHVTFSVGYVTISVRTRLAGMDPTLEQAAADLGANPWSAFWLVTFPRLLPGIVSGALLAFTLSFDDFVVTFFTAGVGAGTLPLKIYAMIKFGVTPEINAISSLMLLTTVGMLGIWSRVESTSTDRSENFCR
jgi:spermidine/putrescine transport system permease protein